MEADRGPRRLHNVEGRREAIVHATNRLMSSLPNNDRWTLLLDFTNAFNSISRQTMFGEFRRHLPGLSAWMESCYSGQPLLLLGKDIIHSCCGVQQGDPLGPLGFALTLHPIIKRIRAEVPSLALNAWYLDDGTLVGSTQDLTPLRTVDSDTETEGGTGPGGREAGADWGCLVNISWRTVAEGVARPSEVRALMALLYWPS